MSASVRDFNEEVKYIPVPISELSEKVSNRDLPHSLMKITYEDGLFVHTKKDGIGFSPDGRIGRIIHQLYRKAIIDWWNSFERLAGFSKFKRNRGNQRKEDVLTNRTAKNLTGR